MKERYLISTIDGDVDCYKRFDGERDFFDCYLNGEHIGEIYDVETKDELENEVDNLLRLIS